MFLLCYYGLLNVGVDATINYLIQIKCTNYPKSDRGEYLSGDPRECEVLLDECVVNAYQVIWCGSLLYTIN